MTNKIKEAISELVLDYDELSGSYTYPYCRTMNLLGSESSPFLRAIEKKAAKFGISTNRDVRTYIDSLWDCATVCDLESENKFTPIYRDDVDRVNRDGLSSTAEALLMLLDKLDLVEGKTITIVGRGHAVKDLAKRLIEFNATVTVAHSQTKSLIEATKNRDVVIYATPKLNDTLENAIAYDTKSLVIDLGNCVKNSHWFMCPYINGHDIGKLTVSVLLNRVIYGWE